VEFQNLYLQSINIRDETVKEYFKEDFVILTAFVGNLLSLLKPSQRQKKDYVVSCVLFLHTYIVSHSCTFRGQYFTFLTKVSSEMSFHYWCTLKGKNSN